MSEKLTLRNEWVAVAGLTLAALVIRLAYVLTLGNAVHWGDEAEYHGIAVNLISGKGYSYFRGPHLTLAPTAYRMPALPVALAAVYWLTGPSLLAARIFGALLGGALVPIAYLIARELDMARKARIISCAILAFYPYYIFAAGAVYPVTMSALLVAIASLLLIKGANRISIRYEVVSGLVMGVGTLAFGHIIGALPFVLGWVIWNKRSGRRAGIFAAMALMLSFLVIVTPWMLRNKIIMGKALLSTALPYNLYVANLPQARWNSGSRIMFMEPAEIKRQTLEMSEGEASSLYAKLALKQIADNPPRFVILSLGRAINFWRFYPNPVSRDVSLLEKLVGCATYGLILLLAIVWFILPDGRKWWRRSSLLLSYPLGAMLIAMFSVSIDRYRLPYDVYLIVFAGAAIQNLGVRLLGKRSYGKEINV